MTNTGWTSRLKYAAWIGMLGLVVLMTCAPGIARAQDDDDEDNSIWNADKRAFKSLMGAIGLKSPTDADIDYRERSPLVVPPSRDLPPPQTDAAPANPAWPVDPDQKRRREAIAARKKAVKAYSQEEAERNLMPHELDRTGSTGSTGTSVAPGNDGNFLPSQLGYIGGLFSMKSLGFGSRDEVGTFTQEPARDTLADPPAGYQTPSPSQPYGVTTRVERKVVKPDRAVGDMD